MWVEQDNKLYRSFKFKDFKEAFAFMAKVAVVAEQKQHHPTWSNTYNQVEIWLNTHDAGNIITQRDYDLANAIDALY